jgi:UDP-glucose 4-epimerase
MSILVTGGAGYIGSHMVRALRDAGEQVVVLDNLSAGFKWAVTKGVPLVIGDVGDKALVTRVIAEHDVEAIIHFAASISVPASVSDPLGYYHNNTVNSHALIKCAIKGGVKQFIFSSTAAVYGNPVHVPIGEDDPTIPLSPYGSSKLMTETMLRDAGTRHWLDYVILRYFNVAGADPHTRIGHAGADPNARVRQKYVPHLINVAVEAVLRKTGMKVFGKDYDTPDGTCIRDYIHVCDLVEAHRNALAYLRHGGAPVTLNCGYGRGFSVLQVIDTVKRVSGVDFPVDFIGRRAGDPARVVAKSDRIRELLGWQPQFDDLVIIISNALAWRRKLTEVYR